MMDVRLLQSQKNDVLDAILNAGLDPAEFTWSDERDPMQNLCSRITHKPSGFSAGSTVDQMAYRTMLVGQFSPGEHFRFERYDASDWQMLLVHTINWALRLANELRQPDRWSIYTDAQALMDAAGDTTGRDGSFSRSERAEIEKQIKAVKAQVAALPGRTEQQIADANAKLDDLVEASKKQGRQAWYFTAVGVIATIATSLNVTPAEARMLFQLVGQGLRDRHLSPARGSSPRLERDSVARCRCPRPLRRAASSDRRSSASLPGRLGVGRGVVRLSRNQARADIMQLASAGTTRGVEERCLPALDGRSKAMSMRLLRCWLTRLRTIHGPGGR